MKFKALRKFAGRTAEELLRFVANDLDRSFKDLVQGLTKLTFRENFDCFEEEVTIGAGSTEMVSNKLRANGVRWIVVRQKGNGLLTEGDTWDAVSLSLKNNGAASVTATVCFMR